MMSFEADSVGMHPVTCYLLEEDVVRSLGTQCFCAHTLGAKHRFCGRGWSRSLAIRSALFDCTSNAQSGLRMCYSSEVFCAYKTGEIKEEPSGEHRCKIFEAFARGGQEHK